MNLDDLLELRWLHVEMKFQQLAPEAFLEKFKRAFIIEQNLQAYTFEI